MKVLVAAARREHAQGIATVAAAALFASIDADCPRMQRILDVGSTFVAIAEGQVAGFVSNFITRDARGAERFELDLLAVSPLWQGRGIGARLVRSSLQAARKSGATTIRALVRCKNQPMQRICSRAGFQKSDKTYHLFVSAVARSGFPDSRPSSARIIPVDTLTYSGYWLEGDLCQSTIFAARHLLSENSKRTQIGAVVSEHDRRTAELLLANSFQRIGDFHWWMFRL